MPNYKDKFVGIKIYGFCNGYFGRDSYDDKIIIASGENWIVAKSEHEGDLPEFATFDDAEEMQEMIEKWKIDEDEEELF
ncbi:hypothetical protein ACW5UC_25440 [Priestia aryabhattai]|uniref:hypothetical protein n=1 Tax=Priestia megaterium TaxID=1404 RepID=UPI003F988B0E